LHRQHPQFRSIHALSVIPNGVKILYCTIHSCYTCPSENMQIQCIMHMGKNSLGDPSTIHIITPHNQHLRRLPISKENASPSPSIFISLMAAIFSNFITAPPLPKTHTSSLSVVISDVSNAGHKHLVSFYVAGPRLVKFIVRKPSPKSTGCCNVSI
jgi:hypothetical protein